MTYQMQCSCGRLRASLNRPRSVNRCVCYCADCQAFARFLKRDTEILDQAGGTEIIQVAPSAITITEGAENLACIRLTENGLLRWYAACCGTPIGNTPSNPRISIIGLIHNCLTQTGNSLDEAFGPIRVYVHTRSARSHPKPRSAGLVGGLFRVVGLILRARLNGSYKENPFFSRDSDTPIATPRVLTNEELKQVKQRA